MSETRDRDYVLGTHDEEIARLGLQHRVWRPRALDAWTRAGFTQGQTLLDVGCGPGHASVDLAELVGPLSSGASHRCVRLTSRAGRPNVSAARCP